MKIALASSPVKNRNIEFNMQAIIDAMNKASGQADVILFGESVLQGFDSLCWDYETDEHMAVALTDAPIQRMRKAAKQYGIAVSFGFIERKDDNLSRDRRTNQGRRFSHRSRISQNAYPPDNDRPSCRTLSSQY